MNWFDEFDEVFHRLNRPFIDLENLIKNVANSGALLGPYIYGYTMTMGPNGQPIVKEFGNVNPTLPDNSGTRQPVVDQILNEKEKQLKLVAEIPGVEKKDVEVNVENNIAHIKASYKDVKYSKDIQLQHRVDEDSAKVSYNNGVLEIAFKLREKEKPKGRVIKIE